MITGLINIFYINKSLIRSYLEVTNIKKIYYLHILIKSRLSISNCCYENNIMFSTLYYTGCADTTLAK